MKPPFELVVFDWDGTLMDSEAKIVASMRAAIADVGLPFRTKKELGNVIGLGLVEAIAALYPGMNGSDQQAVIERFRHYFVSADPTSSELFPGIQGLLQELTDQGYFLGIATGKSRRGLDYVLREHGLTQFFQSTRCADESFSKPHPQMLLEIMQELGVGPSTTLMIGDTEYDLQMAYNAGVKALAVCYGVHDKERLLACQPLAHVNSPSELHAWFMSTNTQQETTNIANSA